MTGRGRSLRIGLAALVAVVAIVFAAATAAAQKHHHHPGGEGEGGKHAGHGSVTPAPADEPDGLPVKWVFVSLGVAALIGAAGGEILVSLEGRRPSQ